VEGLAKQFWNPPAKNLFRRRNQAFLHRGSGCKQLGCRSWRVGSLERLARVPGCEQTAGAGVCDKDIPPPLLHEIVQEILEVPSGLSPERKKEENQ
jgi:hypothetical protein